MAAGQLHTLSQLLGAWNSLLQAVKSLVIRRGHELLEEGGVSEKAPRLTMLCSLSRLELAVGLLMDPAHAKLRQSIQSWDRTLYCNPCRCCPTHADRRRGSMPLWLT